MPKFAANLTWMLGEVDVLDRFQAAADLGFEAVEIQFPFAHAPGELAAAREAAGTAMVMFNAPPGDMNAGEYGIAALPGRESEFKNSIRHALEYAEALNSGHIHVLAGIIADDLDRGDCRAVYQENLAWAAETCAAAGVGVLIEPINTFERPGYLVTTTAEAVDAVNAVNHPNLAIQFDFHNAQLMEGNLTQTLGGAISLIRHMQIAGVPGRTPPDEGEMNYPYLFGLVDALGYDGWLGCEFKPRGTTAGSLEWAQAYGIGPKPG